jgi:hydrogenase-4 component F
MVPTSSNPIETYALIIVLAPLAAAFLTPFLRKKPEIQNLVTILFALLSLVTSIQLAKSVRPPSWRFGLFYFDDLSIYFVLLVNIVAFIASIYAVQFLAFDAKLNLHHDPTYFHIFFNLFHFTMLAVPMVDNLIILWIAVELTTVVSTILVRYQRDRSSLEAAWKFIVITTTGIIFALLGTLFLANAMIDPDTGKLIPELAVSIDPMRWSVLATEKVAKALNPNFVILSFLFVLIGYGTKAGLAPMHTWLPDGHGQAPSPVSALLSGVMLKSALYAILRFYTITNLNLAGGSYSSLTSWILMSVGLFSLVLAMPFIIKRNRFKRVLAYHSLEHMGIITFGIGLGSPAALFWALLHALNHALTKALMFMTFGRVQDEYHSRQEAQEGSAERDSIGGVLTSMPMMGAILGMGGLALVGSPPFSIFLSELMILWSAFNAVKEKHNIFLIVAVCLFIISVTVIFGGLVGHLSRLLLGRPPFSVVRLSRADVLSLVAFLILLAAIFIFGIFIPTWPVDFPQLLNGSIKVILHGAPAQ